MLRRLFGVDRNYVLIHQVGFNPHLQVVAVGVYGRDRHALELILQEHNVIQVKVQVKVTSVWLTIEYSRALANASVTYVK